MKTILKIKWENIFLTISLTLGIMALLAHKHANFESLGFESIFYLGIPIFLKNDIKEARREVLKRC